MPIVRRSDCVPLPIVVRPIVAVVMLESRVARCVHCVENVAWHILHAVGSPDDGHKDARNMLRFYWLPIHHYLLHLVGFSFTYLSKVHGHSNIKLAVFQLLRLAYSNLVGKYVIALYTGNHAKPGHKPYWQNTVIQNLKADFLHTVTTVS